MTVTDLYSLLVKLIADGHGNMKVAVVEALHEKDNLENDDPTEYISDNIVISFEENKFLIKIDEKDMGLFKWNFPKGISC